MKYTKIITHAGTHHADEILAIATIFHFVGELPIERKYTATDKEMTDPSIFVLDIMKKLQPELSNFDHHQDGNIQSTNILILDHLCKDEKLKGSLKKYLFDYVDSVDRGHVVEDRGEGIKVPTFNSIVRNLNNVDGGFDIALQIARSTLTGFVATALSRIDSEE